MKRWPELRLTDAEQASVRLRIVKHIRHTPAGCWEWTGCLFATGYGSIKQRGGRMLAHRVSFAALRGPIPENQTLDHLCRNKACVNPAHLEIVPLSVNVLRNEGPSAINKRKTHCDRGHPLETVNLVNRSGRTHRTCLECHRASSRAAGRRWRAKPENLARHAQQERARRAASKTKSQES